MTPHIIATLQELREYRAKLDQAIETLALLANEPSAPVRPRQAQATAPAAVHRPRPVPPSQEPSPAPEAPRVEKVARSTQPRGAARARADSPLPAIREIIATGHGLPAEFSNHQMLEALQGRWNGTGNKFSQAMNQLGKSGELRFVRREGGSPIWSIPLRRSATPVSEE